MYEEQQVSRRGGLTAIAKAGIVAAIILILVAIGGAWYMKTHVNIKPGEVGYMYDRRLKPGDEKAIEGTAVINKELFGRTKINPIYQELYTYPTKIVSRSWTANNEGKKGVDESFFVGTKEGEKVKVDFYMSFQPSDVGLLIKNFGGKDFDTIIDQDLFGAVKGKIGIVTRAHSVYNFQSELSEIQSKCFELIDKELRDVYGIKLVKAEFGNYNLPQDIQAKIKQKTDKINEVEIAKLERQKQDEENQKLVDKQKAESEKELIKMQKSTDAEAYKLQTMAEAKKKAAVADLESAKLEKEAKLERQKAYTEQYFKDKELDVQKAAVEKINPSVKTIVTDGSGSGLGALPGIKEILNSLEN